MSERHPSIWGDPDDGTEAGGGRRRARRRSRRGDDDPTSTDATTTDDSGPTITVTADRTDPSTPRTATTKPVATGTKGETGTKGVAATPRDAAPARPAPDTSTPSNGGGPGDVLESGVKAPPPIPVAAEPDWEHFSPRPVRAPRPPGRLRRVVGHEWAVATVVAVAVSVLLNRGALISPGDTLPQDTWDPSLVAYLIAWGGFALLADPTHLWHLNAFHPSQYGLAYSDSLLGYAPLGLVGTGPEAAILRYNIIFILAQALVLLGGYALARQLGLGRVAAAVVAVAFAVAPWRLAQAGHLQVLSTGGVVLALAMLARGHGIRFARSRGASGNPSVDSSADAPADTADAGANRDPDGAVPRAAAGRYRPGWALAGWLVATWQVSLGFGVGLVFAYVLLGASVVGALAWASRRRALPPRRLLLADGVGGLVFAAAAVLLAQPYLRVLELYPSTRRDAEWIRLYSPPWRGLLTAPAESLVWGGAHETARAELSLPGEMALLPGFVLLALAVAGTLFSVWAVWVRLALVGGTAITAALALGTYGPAGGEAGYLLLLDTLPGFEGLRTPGRLIIWTTLCLALLAGGGVAALVLRAVAATQRRGSPGPTPAARLALLIPLVLVFVEGLGTTPHVNVPDPPPSLATVAAPYLVLPSDARDVHVMLWSTDRFAPTVNGQSGVTPSELARTRQEVATFPDAASVAYLRGLGVRTVVVPFQLAAGSPWQEAATMSIAGLDIRREVTDDAVLFYLDG